MRQAADSERTPDSTPRGASCLLCGLALIFSHGALAQAAKTPPLFWTAPPSFAAAPGGLSITTPTLGTGLNSASHTSLHGLIDIDRGTRGASIRGGIGMDFDLPDTGKLHLDLLPARDAVSRGMRWDVNGDSGRLEGKLWSLGACLVMIREATQRRDGMGQRHLELAPQLVLDTDRLLQTAGNSRLIVQRLQWSDLKGRDEGLGVVWQLRMVWQF